MKRQRSSDSLGGLMSICTTTDEQNQGYPREIQCIYGGLDEEECLEETGYFNEKKRRLSVNQVKALEKSFDVENKLEPERKVKLAQELGLQPRQVAVWFQNRRARWKTKQLERDYGVLKAKFDSLKHNFDNLKQDNESLLKEVRELKSKLNGETSENKEVLVKEETMLSEHEETNELVIFLSKSDEDVRDVKFENFDSINDGALGVSIFNDFKDGSSDSDSSAILNEENNNRSPNAAICSSRVLQNQSPQHNIFISNGSPSSCASNYNSKDFCFQFSDSSKSILEEGHNDYLPQFVKIEEHNFFSGEDSCSTFFSDDQAPTLQWYTPEVWN